MKKLILLFLLGILLVMAAFCEGQSESPSDRFPTLFFRNNFDNKTEENFFRFPTQRLLFDPLDLSYFPHESWNETDWSLFGRNYVSGTYQQLLILRENTESMILQGTDIGKDMGFLNDFYLYATMFTVDSYPADSGSCYVYYSNSLMKGFKPSRGILIDPASGIYLVENRYAAYYDPATSEHQLKLIKPLSFESFPVPTEKEKTSAYAASDFDANTDTYFVQDLNSMQSSFRMEGSPEVRAYRLEIFRENGIVDFYINGKRAARMPDYITTDVDGVQVPDMVSWSYGPVLYPGGITVTCAVGDLYIYSRDK